MNCISNLTGRFIFDSRGIPTVEAEVTLNNGLSAIASVPSGASTGSKEAVELRDQDSSLYNGKSVSKAVDNINTKIFELLVGLNPLDQNEIDRLLIELDGSKNKGNLGANAILLSLWQYVGYQPILYHYLYTDIYLENKSQCHTIN